MAGGSTISYSYAYDEKGNIISVVDNSGNTTTYSYDGLSQLVRENNQEAGKTWTYSYDSAGNIREKKEYAYTTGNLGTPADTTTYSYTDATWKDILTGVNGTVYTSDAIGNLTNDGEWTYTWHHGRQLAGMSKPGMNIAFTYDADGLRLTKTVTEGSTTTEYKYYYQNGNLTDMIWGGNRQVRKGEKKVTTILKESLKMTAVGAASVYFGVKGIKAQNEPYQKSASLLKSLQGDVGKALKNPVQYKNEIQSAISNHVSVTKTAIKSTTIGFTKATLFANIVSRVKSFLEF